VSEPSGSNARGWGGARPGAGRKPETLSVRQVQAMLEAAEKRAVEAGKSIDELLLDVIYAKTTSTKDFLAAVKLFKDKTMAQITEGGDADCQLGPALFLPEKHPRLKAVDSAKSA
jgi:hypothetical protein